MDVRWCARLLLSFVWEREIWKVLKEALCETCYGLCGWKALDGIGQRWAQG